MNDLPPVGRVDDLPAVGYAGRADRVRQRFDEQALLVSNLTNVRWLTGFTGSNGWVAILPDRLVLGTDGRYRDRAEAELARVGVEAQILTGFTRAEQHAQLIGTLRGISKVGAEASALTHAAWTSLAAEIDIVPSDGHIEAERRVKDAGEIARIGEAARIADVALAAVAPTLGDGLTEVDVRNELDHTMRRLGASGPSYDTIVASGPDNAARPHHEPGTRRIVAGDTVVIDVGALVDGYHSDMTRSYVVGDPSPEQQVIYDLVLEAQLAGLQAVSAGVAARDLDAVCRGVFDDAGHLDWYMHGTGHGVGLLIHEDPFHNQTSTQELLVGDVVTVEPGLYRSGFGGFRVEDLVVVTESGCRILTETPKDSPCLPSRPTT
ncbi:MAG TPA: Xaa-Pro peptidase family protein [Ilumatobacteraceae bacterium]|nr:Xaa-Pro peptidase family protein [Ilumatobacteraceae bacterium]